MAQEHSEVATSRDDDEILEAATANSEPDDIAEARAQIEETRAEMTDTFDAIMYRLGPSTLIEEAKEATIEKAYEAVSGVVDNIKEKAATVAESVGNAYHVAAEHVSDAYHVVTEHVGDTAHNIAAHASDAAQHISEKVDEMRGGSPDATAVPGRYDLITQKNTSIGAQIVETIKLNPVPAAIAGFGIGWLLLSMQRQQKAAAAASAIREYDNDLPDEMLKDASYIAPTVAYSSNFGTATNNGTFVNNGPEAPGLRDRAADVAHNIGDKAFDLAQSVTGKASDIAQSVSEKASDIKGRAGEWAGGVRDSAGQFKDRAGDAVHNLADQTKTQASAAVDATGQFVQEQTLVAAGIALLLGAAVAYAIPATNKENKVLGPQRDRLVDQGKDAAQGVATKVQSVANIALGQAQQSLGQTVDQAKQQIQQTVQQTKETVMSEAHNQGLALAA